MVEACVVSADEAAAAARAGAARLELCRDLEVGGLTPGRHILSAVLEHSEVPLHVMVRPRPGSFRVSGAEVSDMVRGINDLMADAEGVDGIVLGVLDRHGGIDSDALGELVAAACGAPVTFHRAFDEVRDPLASLDLLVAAGVSRVLTSGCARTAWEGRATLRRLVAASGGRITILGGGRVRGDHVRELVDATGLAEVHARASAITGIVSALAAPV